MAGFRAEFQLKNFGFGYDKPNHFYTSAWRLPNGVFIAWRVFWVLWNLAWLGVSIEEEVSIDTGKKWGIWLTNWIFGLLIIQSIVHLFIVLGSTCKTQAQQLHEMRTTTTGLEKILWLLTTVSFDGAVFVTIQFWALVYDNEPTIPLNFVTHGVNMVYAVSDIFISATPVRLLHFIYIVVLGVGFGVFSYLFYLADGINSFGYPYVYKILDWSNPGPTLVIMGAVFVFGIVVHMFLFGLYTLRVFLTERCACGRQDEKRLDNC